MQKLIDFLEFLFKKNIGIWLSFITLLTVLGLCIKGFVWRSKKLMFSADNKLLDSRFFYSPDDVKSFFAYLKDIDTNIYVAPNGIDLYKLTQVSLDFIFPIAYGILFTALIFLLYKKDKEENKKNPPRWLLWIPLLAIFADIGENFITAFLAWSDSISSSSLWIALAWIAWVFTLTKWIMVFSSLLTIVIGIVLLKKFQSLWKYYIFSLRIPIITGILLLFFPILANTIASDLIQNIFVMRGGVQLAVVMIGATMAALMVSFSFERIFDKISESLENQKKYSLGNINSSFRYFSVVILVFSNWIPVLVLSRSQLKGHSLGGGFAIGFVLSAVLLIVIDEFGKDLGTWLKLRLKVIVFLFQKITSKYAKVTFKQQSWRKKFFSFLRLVIIRKLKINISKKDEEDFLGLSLGIIGTIIYLFFFIIYQPGSDIVSKVGEAPALLFVYLIIWILTGILSTGTFVFDQFHVPFVVLLILLSGLCYWFFKVDHFFELTKIGNQSQQITLETALNKRLPTKKNGRNLVVVTASGGGIQASGWTAQVLGGLQEELGSSFTQSIGFISSVSGGSVGTMYFIDDNFDHEKGDSVTQEKNEQKDYCINVNSDDKYKDDLKFKNQALNNIFCNATEDWLDAVLWGAAYPDLIRLTGLLSPFIGKYNDRGYALEHDWQMNMYSPKSTLNNWREKIKSGDIPIPIFNATLVEDGRRFLISPIKLIEGQIEDLVNSNDDDRKVLDFQTLYQGYDLKVATATRLSATFPYVSPLPRNHPSVCYDIAKQDEQFCGNYHFADGGYFDASGIFTAVELIDNKFDVLTKDLNIKRILLLHINPFPESKLETGSKGDKGWFMESIGPLTAAYAVRDSTESSRNLKEVELLQKRKNNQNVKIKSFTIPFPQKNAKTKEKYIQPLSWRLTQQQKKNLKLAWRDFKETDNFRELKRVWKEWQK